MLEMLTARWNRSRSVGAPPLKGLADNPAFQWWRAPATIQPHSTWGRADDAIALARDAAIMRELGVRYFRFEVPWREVQPIGPARFVFQKVDRILDMLARYSIEPLPVVTYTPRWAMDPTAATEASLPSDGGYFGELMAALAGRYRGHVAFWELWNEPDHPHSWSGTIREYVHLILAPGSAAVRDTAPDAGVVLGGLADHANLQAVHDAGGDALYDVASIHHYPSRPSPRRVNRVARQTRTVLERNRNGHRKPLWLTECGIASAQPSLASSFGAFTDEAGQARFVRGLYETVDADAVFVYQLRDTAIFDATGRRLKEVFWGLTDECGARRKPAFDAFREAGVSSARHSPGSAARTRPAHQAGR